MKVRRFALSAFGGVPIAALYALLVRLTFASDEISLFLGTMTCSFLLLVPLAIGALTIRLAPIEYRTSTPYALFMPWLSITIVCAGAMMFSLEAAICILMALPFFLVLSSLGGYLLLLITNSRESQVSRHQNPMLGIILIAPYLFSPIEMSLPTNASYNTVENKITIHASPSAVWENIVTIHPISDNEQGVSIFHNFGVPKLLGTTALTQEGMGGYRSVVFDNGLTFIETVTFWDEKNRIEFSISPVSQSTAPAPYDMVGKKYFAVTAMKYWIESVDQDTVIVHLASRHQVTTHFNSYAGLWTDFMLSSLQSYVLRMIKDRAEAPTLDGY